MPSIPFPPDCYDDLFAAGQMLGGFGLANVTVKCEIRVHYHRVVPAKAGTHAEYALADEINLLAIVISMGSRFRGNDVLNSTLNGDIAFDYVAFALWSADRR